MISLDSISKAFDTHQVLKDISFEVAEGERLCIVGASGSGKSVCLRIMAGLLSPDKGKVSYDGVDTSAFKEKDWNKLMEKVGVVFQGAALFDSLTVFENVAIRLLEERTLSEAEIVPIVEKVLKEVGLQPAQVLQKYPAELSGGMQKRVAIARAIIHQPRYLFYDEPTTGLDPINSTVIDQLIQNHAAVSGRTSIIITHDLFLVENIATKVVMIHKAQLYFQGAVKDFFGSEDKVIKAFLQRNRKPGFSQTL